MNSNMDFDSGSNKCMSRGSDRGMGMDMGSVIDLDMNVNSSMNMHLDSATFLTTRGSSEAVVVSFLFTGEGSGAVTPILATGRSLGVHASFSACFVHFGVQVAVLACLDYVVCGLLSQSVLKHAGAFGRAVQQTCQGSFPKPTVRFLLTV